MSYPQHWVGSHERLSLHKCKALKILRFQISMIRGGPCEACFGALLNTLRSLTTTTTPSTMSTITNANSSTNTNTTSSSSFSHSIPTSNADSSTSRTSSRIPCPEATPDLELDIDFVGYVGQWDLEQNLARLDWERFREVLSGFRCSFLSYHGHRDVHRHRLDRHHNDFRGACTSTSTRVNVRFVDGEGRRWSRMLAESYVKERLDIAGGEGLGVYVG